MARKNANLKIVDQRDEEARRRQQEEEAWKLTRGEIEGRVRKIREYLEGWADRLSGLQFDVLNRDCPASIDGIDPDHPCELAEKLDPFISGCYERLYKRIPGPDAHYLADFKLRVAEVAFAVGVMAGLLFPGTASSRDIDRAQRGLVWALTSERVGVKDD